MMDMDNVYMVGVSIISLMQSSFQGYDEFMLFLSHLGDPHKSFIFYFPLAYHMCHSVGIRVIWVAAISESLNAILKWFLHGERPYWWVQETNVYDPLSPPDLQQFRLTCETGPGSPSGHAMVTSSTLFILTSALIFHKISHSKHRSILTVGLWIVYALYIFLINMSRCYIATHFPHQVLLGTAVGCVIAYFWNGISMQRLNLKHYVLTQTVILVTGFATYWVISELGWNPMWSVEKATKWCANRNWVHLETSLFYALVRDAACLSGLGFAIKMSTTNKISNNTHLVIRICKGFLSFMIINIVDFLPLPKHTVLLFYMLAYAKFFILSFIVVIFVPKLVAFMGRLDEKEHKN